MMNYIKMRYCIISYVCFPRFCFPSKTPLLFTPNPGHYTPKSLCSSPNGLLITPNLLSGFVPVSAVSSGLRQGGGGGVARAKRVARN